VDTETVPAAASDDFVVSSTVPEPVDEPTTSAEPVEALAETDDEHVDSEQPEPDASSDAGKALAKKKGSLQDRINELTREKYDTKREADTARAEAAALRAELAALKAGSPAAAPPSAQRQDAVPPTSSGKPRLEDFDSHEAWVEAVTDWKLDQRIEADKQKALEAEQQKAVQTVAEQAQARINAFRADHPDYDDVVNAAVLPPDAPSSQAVLMHLQHAELGPALAYALGSNPAELARIVSLPPGFAVAALGRLEAQIESRNQAAQSGPASVAAPVTTAPDPIKPVGGASAGASTADPKDISSIAAWNARRKDFL
jgi:hypothetical protein